MRILRLIAFAFLILAAGVAATDFVRHSGHDGPMFRAAGEWWFEVSPSSLEGAQAVIQRYVSPELWDPLLVTVLTWPAFVVLGLVSVKLFAIVLFMRHF